MDYEFQDTRSKHSKNAKYRKEVSEMHIQKKEDQRIHREAKTLKNQQMRSLENNGEKYTSASRSASAMKNAKKLSQTGSAQAKRQQRAEKRKAEKERLANA
eukprot:Awhi_evm1s8295